MVMSTNNVTGSVIDFDVLLEKWAEHCVGHYGNDFVIDTSDIKIAQR